MNCIFIFKPCVWVTDEDNPVLKQSTKLFNICSSNIHDLRDYLASGETTVGPHLKPFNFIEATINIAKLDLTVLYFSICR